MIQIDFFPWWLNCLIILLVVFVVGKNYKAIRKWYRNYERENEKWLAVAKVIFPVAVFILGVYWALGVENSHKAFDGGIVDAIFVIIVPVFFYACTTTASFDNSEEVARQKVYWFVGLALVVIFLFILSISWPKAIIYLVLQIISLLLLYGNIKAIKY